MNRDDELWAKWSKKENDILIGSPCRPDGHLLHGYLSCVREVYYFDMCKLIDGGMNILQAFHQSQGSTMVEELEKRGYDIKTLRFQISRLPGK